MNSSARRQNNKPVRQPQRQERTGANDPELMETLWPDWEPEKNMNSKAKIDPGRNEGMRSALSGRLWNDGGSKARAAYEREAYEKTAYGRPAPREREQKAGGKVWEAMPQPSSSLLGGEKQQKRYYVIGKRALEFPIIGDAFYHAQNFARDIASKTPQPFEHRQLIANDGSNWGSFPGGERGDKPENMRHYQYYDEKRYDAELVDEAIRQLAQEREADRKANANTRYGIGDEAMPRNPDREWFPFSDDCQDYVDEVLARAGKLAKERNRPLFVD